MRIPIRIFRRYPAAQSRVRFAMANLVEQLARALLPLVLCATALAGPAPLPAAAHTDAGIAGRVAFDPVPGAQVPAGLRFDGPGGPVRIGDLLARGPSLLTFVWFDCPNLCPLLLDSLAGSGAGALAAANAQVIIVSMDAAAGQADAEAARRDLAERHPRAGIPERWHFLTGRAADIQALADALGYRFAYDPRKAQFAHPTGLIALDREGRISGSASGMLYAAADIQALLEGTVSPAAPQARANPVLLLCYDYDPATGRYSLAVMKLLRLLAVLCLLALGAALWRWRRREGGGRP